MSQKPVFKPSGKRAVKSEKYAKREKKGQQALPGLDALTDRQKSNLVAGNAPSRDADAPMGGWGRGERMNAARGKSGRLNSKPKGGI